MEEFREWSLFTLAGNDVSVSAIGFVLAAAENEKEALFSIPALVRHKGKAIGITQFDPRDVQNW